MRVAISLVVMLLIGIFLGRLCHAHDGYEQLKSPIGGDCCGGSDCGPVETRGEGNELRVHIVGPPWGEIDAWVSVPENAKLPQAQNPKVGPSACWLPFRGVICYWPGREF